MSPKNDSIWLPQPKGKKEIEPEVPEITPLQKMLQTAYTGPIRNDGSDKFFGLENVR